MAIEKIWEEGSGIYFEDEQGNTVVAADGWWTGCRECGAYVVEILDMRRNQGMVEACRYALEHLTVVGDRDNYLCEVCRS